MGSNSNWNNDSNDEELKRLLNARRHTLLRQHSAPLASKLPEVIRQFLTRTKIPYVVIGGKAAEHHILRQFGNSIKHSNRNLITSTIDYDVIVHPRDFPTFIDEFHKFATGKVDVGALTHVQQDMGPVTVHLIGVKTKAFVDSYLDVHVYKSGFVPRAAPDTANGGLRFANAKWLVDEMQSRPLGNSNFASKALKRHVRLGYLKKLTA